MILLLTSEYEVQQLYIYTVITPRLMFLNILAHLTEVRNFPTAEDEQGQPVEAPLTSLKSAPWLYVTDKLHRTRRCAVDVRVS